MHREFHAGYAANDEIILGATEAMEARHIDPAAVVTIGYTAIPDALEYIQAGQLDATVEQYPAQQASTALRILQAAPATQKVGVPMWVRRAAA